MTIKEFLDNLINFEPLENISFDKSENLSDLFLIAKNMVETSSKHIALAICYGFGFGVNKNLDLFEKELTDSLKYQDYRSYKLLIEVYTKGFRIGKDVIKIAGKEDKVKELTESSKFLVINHYNSKLGYKNLDEIEEIKKLKESNENKKKAYLDDIKRRKNMLLEDNANLSDKEIIENIKYLLLEKSIFEDYLSKLIKVCLKNNKSKSLVKDLVADTIKVNNYHQSLENLSIFPIRELIDNGYNLLALEMLKYCEHEDCTFLNDPNVFLLEAECYLNIKDFDKAYSRVCLAQEVMEEGDIYNEYLLKIEEEKHKYMRGIK